MQDFCIVMANFNSKCNFITIRIVSMIYFTLLCNIISVWRSGDYYKKLNEVIIWLELGY